MFQSHEFTGRLEFSSVLYNYFYLVQSTNVECTKQQSEVLRKSELDFAATFDCYWMSLFDSTTD